MISILRPEGKGRGHTEEGHVTTKAETGVMLPHAQEDGGHQKLGEAGRRVLGPSEGARLCQPLDFGLLVSRTGREWISVVLNHWVRGVLLQQTREANTDTHRKWL